MAKKEKNAEDLLENPMFTGEEDFGGKDMTPFDMAHKTLTTTSGPVLEMMTRSTPKLAEAIGIGQNLMYNFGSDYIRGKVDTLMRVHVSMNGQGRAEIVSSLSSGAGVPGEFYDQGNPTLHSFVDADPDGGIPE